MLRVRGVREVEGLLPMRKLRIRGLMLVVLLLASVAGPLHAQNVTPPAGQPSAAEADDRRRFDELLALVVGPNSANVRRTGARELLRLGLAETPARLLEILTSVNNRAAKLAIAQALADVPGALDAVYVAPLIELLGDSEVALREAVMQTLALYRDHGVIARLRDRALDADTSLTLRQAAIDALALSTSRESIAALMEIVTTTVSPIRETALAAVERATAMSFRQDVTRAQQWWEDARQLSSGDWQQLQMERLVRQNRTAAQRLTETEARLRATLRDAYFRAAESERSAIALAYLSDSLAVVRLLGLELVRAQLVEGRPITPEVEARARALLTADESAVRAGAVTAIVGLRNAADAEPFVAMLAQERSAEVRAALINALGYLGNGAVLSTLTEYLSERNAAVVGEAATALGRLAERGALDDTGRAHAGVLLAQRFGSVPVEDGVLREVLMAAMSRMGLPQLGVVFRAALASEELVGVRRAAARGLAILADPSASPRGPSAVDGLPPAMSADALGEALGSACGDHDPGVRRAAAEGLAALASSDEELHALWQRAEPSIEPEAAVREVAWRGVLRVLAGRPADDINAWIARLSESGADRRRVELLALLERELVGRSPRSAALADVQERLAAEHRALGEATDGLRALRRALRTWLEADVGEARRVAEDVLVAALRKGAYDAAVAADVGAVLDGAAAWGVAARVLDELITPDTAGAVLDALVAFQLDPPGSLDDEAEEQLQQMIVRAFDMRRQVYRQRVADAVARLRANPQDEAARASISTLGDRAAEGLYHALLEELSGDAASEPLERLLHDLLRRAAPFWDGFDPGADPDTKRESLDRLRPVRMQTALQPA